MTAATWKKIQRNAQRRRKIVVGDDDLEHLARLSLCTRHRRSSQITNLVRRIKDDITAHNQNPTARKPAATTTTTSEMDPSSSAADTLASGYATRESFQVTLNVPLEVYVSHAAEIDANESSPRPRYRVYRRSYEYEPNLSLQPRSVTQGGQDQMNQSPEGNQSSHQDSRRKPTAPSDECSICLEGMESQQDLVWCRKQCGTNFHRICIVPWLGYNKPWTKSCPACRVVWTRRRDWGDSVDPALAG
jgi:hypothetical protein